MLFLHFKWKKPKILLKKEKELSFFCTLKNQLILLVQDETSDLFSFSKNTEYRNSDF